MDNESTAAFEAWHNEEFGWYNPDDIQWQKRLRTWNASRKQTFEESVKACRNLQCGWNSDDQLQCITAIRN